MCRGRANGFFEVDGSGGGFELLDAVGRFVADVGKPKPGPVIGPVEKGFVYSAPDHGGAYVRRIAGSGHGKANLVAGAGFQQPGHYQLKTAVAAVDKRDLAGGV